LLVILRDGLPVRRQPNLRPLDGRRPSRCDTVLNETDMKLEIWGKAQRESARRPKSDWKEIRGGGKISSAPKSRDPNSNALTYAERALST